MGCAAFRNPHRFFASFIDSCASFKSQLHVRVHLKTHHLHLQGFNNWSGAYTSGDRTSAYVQRKIIVNILHRADFNPIITTSCSITAISVSSVSTGSVAMQVPGTSCSISSINSVPGRAKERPMEFQWMMHFTGSVLLPISVGKVLVPVTWMKSQVWRQQERT